MPVLIHRTFAQYSLPSNWHQSLQATTLSIPVLRGSLIMDAEKLHSNIRSQLGEDPISAEHLDKQSETLDPLPQWFTKEFWTNLCSRLWKSSTLCSPILTHDHSLAGHFGQTKTLHQVQMHYYWPGLLVFVKDYCKSCTICSHAKPVHHKPYRLLKQFPIPAKPLEFHLHGFHREAPSIFWLYLDPSHC